MNEKPTLLAGREVRELCNKAKFETSVGHLIKVYG
jgi:hypothetical protein